MPAPSLATPRTQDDEHEQRQGDTEHDRAPAGAAEGRGRGVGVEGPQHRVHFARRRGPRCADGGARESREGHLAVAVNANYGAGTEVIARRGHVEDPDAFGAPGVRHAYTFGSSARSNRSRIERRCPFTRPSAVPVSGMACGVP